MTSLRQLSNDFADLIEGVGSSVVQVRGGRRASSGVALEDGLVVTTSHSLRRDDEVEVRLESGDSVSAEIIGRDPATDLAALRVSGVAAARWGDGSSLRVGTLVLVLGRPGRTVRATLGLVSGLGDAWWTALGGRVDRFVDVDANLPPGFTGGPLVGPDGDVVGLNTAHLVRGGTSIPAATVRRVVASLREHGRVRHGYLGVAVQPARVPLPGGEEVSGLLVTGVQGGGPAAGAGIIVGDIVLTVAEQPVGSLHDLVGALSDLAGREVTVEVLRAGVRHTVTTTAADRPTRRRC